MEVEDFADDFGVLDQWAFGIERVSSGGAKLERIGRFIIGDEVITAKYSVECTLAANAFKEKILKQGIKYSSQYRYWFIYDSVKKLLMLFLYPFYKSLAPQAPSPPADPKSLDDVQPA